MATSWEEAMWANFKPEASPPVTEDRATWGAYTDSQELVNVLKDEIKGKSIYIDGVAAGSISCETAKVLATAGPRLIILSARSASRVEAAEAEVKKANPSVVVKFVPMDLGSLASVRKAADEISTWTEPNSQDKLQIDVIINSAGIMAAPYAKTEDGFESQFGICHLAHFVFTNRLLKNGMVAEGGRIVNVSSGGHLLSNVHFEDPGFKDGETYDPWLGYGQAKTACVLYSLGLSEKGSLKSKGITAFSVHPGGIQTPLARHVDKDIFKLLMERQASATAPDWQSSTAMKTLAQGASTYVAAAFDPTIKGSSGSYMVNCRPAEAAPWAMDPEEARKLWTLSEQLVGETFDF